MRRALASFRSEYPEDANGLQTGYELIANRIEQGAGYRAAAQRYFDEDPGSSLRRFVRRHCLGAPEPRNVRHSASLGASLATRAPRRGPQEADPKTLAISDKALEHGRDAG